MGEILGVEMAWTEPPVAKGMLTLCQSVHPHPYTTQQPHHVHRPAHQGMSDSDAARSREGRIAVAGY